MVFSLPGLFFNGPPSGVCVHRRLSAVPRFLPPLFCVLFVFPWRVLRVAFAMFGPFRLCSSGEGPRTASLYKWLTLHVWAPKPGTRRAPFRRKSLWRKGIKISAEGHFSSSRVARIQLSLPRVRLLYVGRSCCESSSGPGRGEMLEAVSYPLRRFADRASSGGRMRAEKTPKRVMHADLSGRMVPQMRCFPILHEPREVFCSVRQGPWGPNSVTEFVRYDRGLMNQVWHAQRGREQPPADLRLALGRSPSVPGLMAKERGRTRGAAPRSYAVIAGRLSVTPLRGP